ncbi:MAG: PAS domain-containing protein, partial [Candidatus Phaeomarinobacter sp.]
MQDGGSGETLPSWSQPAFDPDHVRSVKTAFSGQTGSLPSVSEDMTLTHVGREMLAYWHGTRGANSMPDTSQINPADFRELLPYSRYLSWEGPDDLRIRVLGSALSAAIGIDLTGMNLIDLLGPEERDDDLVGFRALHAHPCGSVTIKRSHIVGGGTREIELVHLPVAGMSASGEGLANGDRILGSIMLRDLPDRWDGVP